MKGISRELDEFDKRVGKTPVGVHFNLYQFMCDEIERLREIIQRLENQIEEQKKEEIENIDIICRLKIKIHCLKERIVKE